MKAQIIILALILTLLFSACTSDETPGGSPGEIPEASTQITVFYTNDEHGWMAGEEPGSEAANLAGIWDESPYAQNSNILILSGGDNWTGPAISTWFDGESMVEVMNAMGYDLSAIGNHEFDFGLEVLKTRLSQASFPYLAANLRYKDDNSIPTDLGVKPYTIIEFGDVKIGVIGLSNTITPQTTNPEYVESFNFLDYEPVMREYVPKMRSEGANLVFVVSHICTDDLNRLAFQVKNLDIPLMAGGHCHELAARQVSDTVILSSGSKMAGYAYAQFTFDPETKEIANLDFGTAKNEGGKADNEVAEIVSKWQAKTDAELNTVIGYLENEVLQYSQAMDDLITGSWLNGYPGADIAITNRGGIRDSLPAGDISLAHVVSVLPFDNVLVDVKLTGQQIQEVIEAGDKPPAVGGIRKSGTGWVLKTSGQPLDMTATYSVLVNDFMYAGGDDYTMLAKYDPDAYNTTIDWRQPVIDWITAQKSTQENPLDTAISTLGD